MMKVLITAPWPEQRFEELQRSFPSIEFVTATTPEELVAAATDAEVAIGRLSREAFLAAKKLRWVQSSSAGVEWMRDIPELIESDVMVTNTRGAHAGTIAEHTFGMLIFLSARLGCAPWSSHRSACPA
jgi:phosphoglycerate dehydrogenase-like enzyme